MPAGETYTAIASTTLTTYATTITLSSIPSTYTDLILVYSGGISSGVRNKIRFNSDSGNNYSFINGNAIFNSSSLTAESGNNLNGLQFGAFHSFNNEPLDTYVVHIANYASTSVTKSVVAQGGTYLQMWWAGGYWNSTAAINSLTILVDGSQQFYQGCNLTLYGVTAA